MNFFTTHDAPVTVTIDDQTYRLPRFLLGSLKEWAAQIEEEDRQKLRDALKTEEEQARFDNYYQPLPVDIRRLMQRTLSPEGTEYVVRHCMKAGGVPDEVIEKIIAQASPVQLTDLADNLATAAQSAANLKIEGEDGSPLTQPPRVSGGSQETGQQSTQDSSTSTPAETPTE